jgi:hypothetical protein
VSGNLAIIVVDADLGAIGSLVADPFVLALVAGASSDVKAALQTAIGLCSSGVQQGNLEDIQRCIAAVRTETAHASDPTDRALLAVLNLFADLIERLLNV